MHRQFSAMLSIGGVTPLSARLRARKAIATPCLPAGIDAGTVSAKYALPVGVVSNGTASVGCEARG